MLVTMRGRNALLIFGMVLVLGVLALADAGVSAQGEPPITPVIYAGAVTVGGEPAPDGLQITARIRDYDSDPVFTKGGRYDRLNVQPPASTYRFLPVTFHILAFGIQAAEEDPLFLGGPDFKDDFNLTFPGLPTPTPTTTPTPTPIPTPTATPTPSPTATPDIAATVAAQILALLAQTPTPEPPTLPPTPAPTPEAAPTPNPSPSPSHTPTSAPTPTPDIRATVLAEVAATAAAEAPATATWIAGLIARNVPEEEARWDGGVCNRGTSVDVVLLLGTGALLGLLAWRRARS